MFSVVILCSSISEINFRETRHETTKFLPHIDNDVVRSSFYDDDVIIIIIYILIKVLRFRETKWGIGTGLSVH